MPTCSTCPYTNECVFTDGGKEVTKREYFWDTIIEGVQLYTSAVESLTRPKVFHSLGKPAVFLPSTPVGFDLLVSKIHSAMMLSMLMSSCASCEIPKIYPIVVVDDTSKGQRATSNRMAVDGVMLQEKCSK